MDCVDIITKKRDGQSLTEEQISWLVEEYVKDNIPDYQMSSFLMAVYFQGMTGREVTDLTNAMINSGKKIDLSFFVLPLVDKHSTGGVGDKISLLLAPLVAGAGVAVPMMSGRGLGHTGGTLDKLEAIPGLRTDLSVEEFKKEIGNIGYAMAGQTKELVPADRKMYALRDVTATVPSIPLICASIISKKKAEGAQGLVLDVKAGRGSFLQSREKTKELAKALVHLGNKTGMHTVALLTDMDEPIGFTVGNWLETKEAILTLKQGDGPNDVIEITTVLGALMLVLGKKANSVDMGREMITRVLKSGKGFELFRDMVKIQGGDISFVDEPEMYALPKYLRIIKSHNTGYISVIDALKIGLAAGLLGAGRKTMEDIIDPGAGIVLHKKVGDLVEKNSELATLYSSKESLLDEAESMLDEVWEFTEKAVTDKISRIIGVYDEYGKVSI